MLGVIGDIGQDILVRPQEVIRPGTDTSSVIMTSRGGSAANVAAFSALRHPTRFIGCVGDDMAGVQLIQHLESRGVEVRTQIRGSTAMIVVMIDSAGERSMFPSRGACAHIHPIAEDWLAGIEILHVTGYSLQCEPSASSILDAAGRVNAAGGRISLDVSSAGMIADFGVTGFRDLVVDLMPAFVSCNRQEAELLGLTQGGGPGPFLPRIPDTTVLARAGSLPTQIFQGTELVLEVPVPPVARIADMTGAGDAFNTGFLSAVLDGADLRDACEEGHGLARQVIAHPGANDGL